MKKFKLIKQHDQKDCGVACLAMVLNHFNSHIPISKLRLMSGTNNQGTSAYGLMQALKSLGFDSDAFQVDSTIWDESELTFPVIAHVVINQSFLHYVVVYGIKKDRLLVADPAKGKKEIPIEEFAKEWTGIILTATPKDNYQPTIIDSNGLLSFVSLLKVHKLSIAKIVVLSFFLTGFGIVGSYYFQAILDQILPQKSINLLTTISLGLLCMYFIQTVFQYLKQYLLIILGQELSETVMLNYFNHVLHLPMNFFSTRKSGEIISRFLDANKIIDALANATLTLFLDVVMVITIGIALFTQNQMLFFISLGTIPVYALIVFSFMKVFDRSNEEQMEAGSVLNSQIIESLKGIEMIKSFNAADTVYEKVQTNFKSLMTKSLKNSNLDNIQTNLKNALQLFSTTILLWVGTTLVLKGQLTIGQLITYNALMTFFTTPLQNIINLQVKIQAAKVANDRLNEIIYLEQESLVGDNLLPNLNMNQESYIEFRNVSFAYGFEDNVLNNISCSIKKNSKVAIVGMSGSGKSTWAKLLMNFYDVQEGSIYYQGHDLQTISRHAVRNSISYVSQDSFFFSGTIIENLTFGLPHRPTSDEIIHACETAKIRDYIESLPLNY